MFHSQGNRSKQYKVLQQCNTPNLDTQKYKQMSYWINAILYTFIIVINSFLLMCEITVICVVDKWLQMKYNKPNVLL
jgi:hypothetical protein